MRQRLPPRNLQRSVRPLRRSAGRDYRPTGDPVRVEEHDFATEDGRATPYGVLDIANNEAFVNVGLGPDTAEFAVESIENTQNWRGTPLTSVEVIVNLIANTTNNKGLKVVAERSKSNYETGVRVSDEQMKAIKIKGDAFHPEWNYTISP